MNRRNLRRVFWVCPALLTTSCGGGEPPPPARPQPAPVTTVEAAQTAFVSPARWSFHPPTPTTATASVILADGSCLFTTDEGLRIRTTKAERSATGSVTCRGSATAAAEVTPEGLVGMVERAASSWLFIGESGTLYEAAAPLESFRRVIGAPTTFTRVTGNGKTVLAVTLSGEIFRLEESSTWQKLNVSGARAFDVVVGDDGSALTLALPEKLFTSTDGQTFVQASAGDTIGAHQVGRTSSGALGVEGSSGTIVWEPNKTPTLTPTNERLVSRSSTLDLDVSTVPTASAIVEGRAAIDGDRYVEAVLVDEETGTWGLASGPFEGPLSTTRLSNTTNCAWMRVGARGRHVTTVCVKTDDDGTHVALVNMSGDGGTKFGEPARFVVGDGDLVGVAVANDGSALITGVCKARTGGSGCSGSPPVLFRLEKGAILSTLAATPPLMGLPISPAFSVDGRSAYFLARRAKDEKLALFVSHEGGHAFTERALDARADRGAKDPGSEGDDSNEGESTEESFDPSDLTTVRPSDDGTLGMVLTTSHGLSYLTTDEDGRVIGMSHPPVEQAIVGGYGRRVLAVASAPDRSSGADATITAWESGDGGSSWNELSTTRSLLREIVTGPLTAACSSAGCLVGNTITRVGWDGQSDAPSITKPKTPEPQKVNAVRTPLVCTLDPKTPWKRIDHVWTGPPTLSATARGRALWSVLSFDPATSAVSTTAAIVPERGEGPARVTTRPMFGPAPKGTEYAVDVALQVEGYAAARVRLPPGDQVTGPMRNVEIGWENYFDGTSKQTSIPDAGTFIEGDVRQGEHRRFLDTGLLSVTSGAIFVRPHARGSTDARLFLLDTKGKRSTPSFPAWSKLAHAGARDVSFDTAIADGKPMAVGTIGPSSGETNVPLTIQLASAEENGSSKTTTTALFPPTSTDHLRILSHDWTYRGSTEVGVIGISSEPRANRATAQFFPFRADGNFGASAELPTPFDLPEVPRPCKAEERRTTPRIAAHAISGNDLMFPGYRHPVFVSEEQKDKPSLDDALVLLTWGTILHGTKEAPCVAAWEAFGITPIGTVAVIGGDPSQAWLFRRVQDGSTEPGALRLGRLSLRREDEMLEHRPMSCRFDSSANIPESVWAQPGAFRWTTK